MILKHKKTAHISPCTAVKPTQRATALENASSVEQWENTDTKPTRGRPMCSWKHGRSNPNKQEPGKNNKKRNWLHPFLLYVLNTDPWQKRNIHIQAYQSVSGQDLSPRRVLLHNDVKKNHRLSICGSNSINQTTNGAQPELFGCLSLDAKEKSLTTCLHLWPHKLWTAKHWFTLARHVKKIYSRISTLFTPFSISLSSKEFTRYL